MMARLASLYRWWLSGLTMLVPDGMRAIARRDRADWLAIDVASEDGAATIGYLPGGPTGDRTMEMHSFDMNEDSQSRAHALAWAKSRRTSAVKMVASIPKEKVLVKVLSFPLSAEPNLRELLGFEIERQTPFSADQVYFNFRILSRDSRLKRLKVELNVVPRRIAEALLDRLAQMDLHPTMLAVGDDLIAAESVNLLPEQREAVDVRGNGVVKLLWSGVALLAAAVFCLYAMQMSTHSRLLDEAVASAKQQADEVAALRDRRDRLLQRTNFINDVMNRRPPVIEVLRSLTHTLPDDTWLQQLEINGDRIEMQGQAKSAATLIGLIEASRLFTDTAFKSPVTRDDGVDRERFYISARVLSEVPR